MSGLDFDGVELDALVFDFDGVLCDSARECFVIAGLAHGSLPVQPPRPLAARSEAERKALESAFLQSRWLVRPPWQFGVLYDLLLELTQPGTSPDVIARAAQARFGRAIETWPHSRDAYQTAFFEHRARLRAEDPQAWFRLNPAFGPALRLLEQLTASQRTAIVSTKDEASIQAWLASSGLAFPESRIFGARAVASLGKAGSLEAIARSAGWRPGRVGFLDDNLENLLPCHEAGFACWLVEWGYTIPGGSPREGTNTNGHSVRPLALATVENHLVLANAETDREGTP